MITFVEQVKKQAFLDSAASQRGLPVCLAEEEIKKAQESLGFALPDLLHQLYTEVANGGFGPGLRASNKNACVGITQTWQKSWCLMNFGRSWNRSCRRIAPILARGAVRPFLIGRL
jgi:hypothetical protein